MAGFFDGIADFLFQLFSGDPETLRLRKQLRELQETVMSVRPAVFNKTTGEVLPGFAQSWLSFYQLVLPLFEVFSKTLASTEKQVEALSRQYLVEALLVGEVTDRRLALGYDRLKERLTGSANLNNDLVALNLEFSNLVSDIRAQNPTALDREIHELFKLKNLVTYSFQNLFRKFGYDLSQIGKEAPRFVSVNGDNILPDLLDLYFLIGGLEVTPSLQRGLGILLERLGSTTAAQNLRKMEKLLDRLRDLLRGPCSPYLTLTLIRLLRQEPEFTPEVWKPKDSPIQDYLDGLSDRWNRDRDRVTRELSENSLQADIQELFTSSHLLEPENYNSATDAEFREAGFAGLDHVTPLALLKSFSVSVLLGGFIDQAKLIVLNGFFQDKDYVAKLNANLLGLEKVVVRIDAFDRNLKAEGKTSFVSLEKYFQGKASGMTVPNQIIDKINRQVIELVEKEVNEIAQLTIRTSEILQDYRLPQPQFVTNIKGIGGKNHRKIISGLVNGYNKSVQFLKIMKNFVVIRGFKIN